MVLGILYSRETYVDKPEGSKTCFGMGLLLHSTQRDIKSIKEIYLKR